MSENNEQYYRALDLPPSATAEEVHQAYRDLVRIWDPQRFAQSPHLEAMAEEKLRGIIAAYHALAPTLAASETGETQRREAKPPESATDMLPIADHNVTEPVSPPTAPRHIPSIFVPEPPRGVPASEVARQSQSQSQPHALLTEPAEPAPAAPGTPDAPTPASPPEASASPAPSARPAAGAASGAPEYRTIEPAKSRRKKPLSTPAIVGIALVPLVLVAIGLLIYDGLWGARAQRGTPPLSPDTAALLKVPPPEGSPTPGAAALTGAAPRPASRRPRQETSATPIPLPTGAELMEPQGRKGAGRFRILNRSGRDAVVRVTAQGSTAPLRLVYVRNATDITITDIGTGVYLVSFSVDPVSTKRPSFGAPFGPFQFIQIDSVSGAQSDEYQIVLRPTR
jgi:hypothetical protein